MLDRRPVAGGLPRVFFLEWPEDVSGKLKDLRGRPVAESKRFDLHVIESKLGEHRSPIRKAVVHMEALRRIAGECDGLARARRIEDDLELDGAHVLGLVDKDMLVGEQLLAAADERARDKLMKPKEDGIVLCIEPRPLLLHIVVELKRGTRAIDLTRSVALLVLCLAESTIFE